MDKNIRNGLTQEEQEIMSLIVKVWEKYIKLNRQHVNDTQVFNMAIHTLQSLLAMRSIRRDYPEYWHNKE